ncbi:MAG TPA: polysaccharide deacetylase family protein [Myxococcaceae bacterium]|nr:polysaccharide deacetylase family protein [Myxococcaceae bacterium]
MTSLLLALLAAGSPPAAPGVPPASPPPMRVAVTVDDLPRHGPEAPGQDRLALHRALLESLAAHHLPKVYGFVNSGRAEPGDRAALEAWVAAGHPLGNHTAHHPSIGQVGMAGYLADVDAGEPLLAELLGPGQERVWKLFRYPYLWQGTDVPSRLALRRALVERGYRIAEVTIDFDDWAYNAPYVRCLGRGDSQAVAALEEMFLDAAVAQLRWADDTLRRLVGRPVPHVLLLHAGAFDAHILDRLLTAYEKAGVRWIPLEQSIADPVYLHEPDPPRSWRGELPVQMIRSRQIAGFPIPASPAPLLERFCASPGDAAKHPDP